MKKISLKKLNRHERIFIKIVMSYVKHYPEHSFKFNFDNIDFPRIGNSDKVIKVNFHDSDKLFHRIFTEGSLGLGESYCEGKIEVADCDYKHFLMIFVRVISNSRLLFNLSLFDIYYVLKAKFAGSFFSYHSQKDDVNSAYSLDNWFENDDDANQFHLLWINSNYVQYTCAKWDKETRGLEDAQRNKFDFYAKRLGIDKSKKGKIMLDLGCGWGGLMFYFADKYGLICNGITLSTAQAKYINDEIKRREMKGRVSVKNINAHDMRGKYDYIISVGLLDHIDDYHDLYKKTAQTLKKDGKALYHDMFHFERIYKPDPFLLKYVFPGGSTTHMNSNLKIFKKYFKHVDRNDLPYMSYPKTLECWFNNFCNNEDKIKQLLIKKSNCADIEYSVRIFKHYLMLSYCGLTESGVVSNILVYN